MQRGGAVKLCRRHHLLACTPAAGGQAGSQRTVAAKERVGRLAALAALAAKHGVLGGRHLACLDGVDTIVARALARGAALCPQRVGGATLLLS